MPVHDPSAEEAQRRIGGFLVAAEGRVRRRRLGHLLGWWALGALTLALAVLALAGVLGARWGGPMALIGVPLLALPLLALAWVALRARQGGGGEAMARLAAARLGDELLSSVELGRTRDAVRASGASLELVAELERRVAARLEGVDPVALADTLSLPTRPPPRRAVLAVLGAWAGSALLAPGLLGRGWASLTAGQAALTAEEPLLADLEVALHFPAYLSRPDEVLPPGSGQVRVPPGTEVRVTGTLLPSMEQVRDAELEVREASGGRAPGEARLEGGKVTGRFTVKGPGSYRFVLARGRTRLAEPAPHPVEIEPDAAPRVELRAPADPLALPEPRPVELAWSAEDDHGLSSVELVVRVPGRPEKRLPVARTGGGARDGGRTVWDVPALALLPGTRVSYHLEARDDDAVSGPKVGRSRVLTLLVDDPKQRKERALAGVEALLEPTLQHLADRLEVAPAPTAGRPAPARAKLHPSLVALAHAFAQAARALDDDGRGRALKRAVAELAADLGALARDEGAELAAERELPRAKVIDRLERTALKLDDLLGRSHLETMLALSDELKRGRDRLKELLERYKATNDPAVKAALERELAALERKLAELAARAAKLERELPSEFMNRDAIEDRAMANGLDRMRQLLAAGRLDEAMRELDRLSRSVDRMSASLEQDLRGLRRERFGPEERALAELEEKVSELAHDEAQLKDETQRLRARGARPDPSHLGQLKAQARALRQEVEGVSARDVVGGDRDELDRARQRVRDVERLIEAGELEEAGAMANEAGRALGSVADDLSALERFGEVARPESWATRRRVEGAAHDARQLAEALRSGRGSAPTSPEDAQKMGELAARQAAARRRARELAERLGQREQDGQPGSPPGARQTLESVGRDMERAEGELRRGAPRPAEGAEGQALEKLGALRDQLAEARRPREGGGTRPADEPVEIPGGERAPRRYREDLLEAMKRQAPSRYREQVKRYYEELVK